MEALRRTTSTGTTGAAYYSEGICKQADLALDIIGHVWWLATIDAHRDDDAVKDLEHVNTTIQILLEELNGG